MSRPVAPMDRSAPRAGRAAAGQPDDGVDRDHFAGNRWTSAGSRAAASSTATDRSSGTGMRSLVRDRLTAAGPRSALWLSENKYRFDSVLMRLVGPVLPGPSD